MSKFEAIIKQFEKALQRLDEVLREPKNSIKIYSELPTVLKYLERLLKAIKRSI